jgi:hypothetical protein
MTSTSSTEAPGKSEDKPNAQQAQALLGLRERHDEGDQKQDRQGDAHDGGYKANRARSPLAARDKDAGEAEDKPHEAKQDRRVSQGQEPSEMF